MTRKSLLSLLFAVAILNAIPSATKAEDPASRPFNMTASALQVGLIVSDGEKSAEYYEKVIGMKRLPGALPLPEQGKMIRMQHGPTVVKLLAYPGEKPKSPGGIQAGIGIRLMSFFAPDLNVIAQRAVEAGYPKSSPAGPPGKRLLFLSDPDGNQLEIFEIAPEMDKETAEKFWIGLTVGDAEASKKFYGEALGLDYLGEVRLFGKSGPPKHQYTAGRTTIKFWKLERELPKMSGAFDAMLGIRYFTFMVPDVDAVYEELKAKQVTIPRPPADFGGLARVMFVEDPDGNWIEFAQVGAKKPKG